MGATDPSTPPAGNTPASGTTTGPVPGTPSNPSVSGPPAPPVPPAPPAPSRTAEPDHPAAKYGRPSLADAAVDAAERAQRGRGKTPTARS